MSGSPTNVAAKKTSLESTEDSSSPRTTAAKSINSPNSSRRTFVPGIRGTLSSVKETYRNVLEDRTFRKLKANDINSSFLESLSTELKDFWMANVEETFPGTPKNVKFFVQATSALIDYFKIVQMANGEDTCLPSKSVDCIWQIWMKFDDHCRQNKLPNQSSLENICYKVADKLVPHPKDLPLLSYEDNEIALARTYVLNCKIDSIDFKLGPIPTLFGLDLRLKMGFGKAYFRRKYIMHAEMNEKGQPIGAALNHDKICLKTFQDLGFILEPQTHFKIFDNEYRGPEEFGSAAINAGDRESYRGSVGQVGEEEKIDFKS